MVTQSSSLSLPILSTHTHNADLCNLSGLEPVDTHHHQDKHTRDLQVQYLANTGDCNLHCYLHMG